MKNLAIKITITFTLLFLFAFQLKHNKQKLVKNECFKKYKTEYLIVFVIDGPRYTETFGDTSYSLIPRMGKELKKEGTLFTNFMNNGVTHTCPGHTAITTGVYQSISNDGKEIPKNPSFFQYYLSQNGDKNLDTWIIASKGKLDVLGNTKNKKWKDKFLPKTYCGPNGNSKEYEGDAVMWKKIEEVFTSTSPKLSLINLLEVDVKGHQKDWEGYKQGLRNSDEFVYKFWKIIQSNPLMKDKTTLLITNDHGRHLDGRKDSFVSHGDKCLGCRKISLLAIGPDIKKDFETSSPAELIDISKTISEIFHFDMPSSKGRILNEMFID